MHWIVPFAAPLTEAGREALATLDLPGLDALAATGPQAAHESADAFTPHPPHERALARALGWAVADDAPLPWAARAARADGLDVGALAWGLLTPVHWRAGRDAVHLVDPGELALDSAESRTLFEAARPLFESEGVALHWAAPLRWYAAHASLATLATASLDRVVGRNVDAWLPAQREARWLRRLQNEVQMLWHTHPLNAQREARGQLPVNSFWLSGCGVAQAEAAAEVRLDERLRAPALAEDWAAWRTAWAALDRERVAARDFTRLTLCGERGSITFEARAVSWRQRLVRAFVSPRGRARAVLEAL
ncbi:MAG TPA: hypothetical protein VFQ16_00725 [Burkholderiaceae bacterium]|nr:hypothetical protein [Burkholderiaceae bacterium]